MQQFNRKQDKPDMRYDVNHYLFKPESSTINISPLFDISLIEECITIFSSDLNVLTTSDMDLFLLNASDVDIFVDLNALNASGMNVFLLNTSGIDVFLNDSNVFPEVSDLNAQSS
jgi:hypothetical protein